MLDRDYHATESWLVRATFLLLMLAIKLRKAVNLSPFPPCQDNCLIKSFVIESLGSMLNEYKILEPPKDVYDASAIDLCGIHLLLLMENRGATLWKGIETPDPLSRQPKPLQSSHAISRTSQRSVEMKNKKLLDIFHVHDCRRSEVTQDERIFLRTQFSKTGK